MLSFLRNHPFAVEAFFESSIVLTFAVSKQQLQPLIPRCLELDTFEDQYGFIAVAMVQTKSLRPKGFPAIFGKDFFLIGYRVFVRYTNKAGKRLRGLYILKSQTDKKKMEFFGNLFTHYDYTTIDISSTKRNNILEITSIASRFKVILKEADDDNVTLPTDSPFPDWKTARRYAGPLPFTFTVNREANEVLIIEGVRQNWEPQPIQVLDFYLPFLNALDLENIQVANAFIIKDVPYYWKKGKLESWKEG